MDIFVSICGLIACFLFASGLAGGAAKAFHEKRWWDFGIDITLCMCFWFGICIILQLWCGMA